MISKIVQWDEIKDKYKDTVILGNGASIAVDERFNYKSLYDAAKNHNLINSNITTLFENFKTYDFESILHKLLQASVVNQTLSIDNRIVQSAYQTCRKSLIDVLQIVHPKYNDINVEDFDNIANFLKHFNKVITLNYDLILYWSIYRGNLPVYDHNGESLEEGNLFKDGFIEKSNGDKCFIHDWAFLEKPHSTRKKSILIFYLHGNLSLASMIKDQIYELDVKITSQEDSHLDVIFTKWTTGNYTPLFICEGESNKKLYSIKSNNYLSIVFYDVLERLSDAIVFYGFNFNNQDDHLITRLSEISRKRPIRHLAISVYIDGNENKFIQRVSEAINNKIGRNIIVEFFDSKSKNCWNN